MKELNKEEMLKVEGGSPSRPEGDGMPKNTTPTPSPHNHPEDSTTCYYCNTSPHLA